MRACIVYLGRLSGVAVHNQGDLALHSLFSLLRYGAHLGLQSHTSSELTALKSSSEATSRIGAHDDDESGIDSEGVGGHGGGDSVLECTLLGKVELFTGRKPLVQELELDVEAPRKLFAREHN
jgi:hypothetical protein